MGKRKHTRKSKPAGEASLMEVSQSYIGVLTRAKALALKRLQKLSAAETTVEARGSDLQLRSRRLTKRPISAVGSKRRKHCSSDGKLGFRMGENLEIEEIGEGKQRVSRESTPMRLMIPADPGSTKTMYIPTTEELDMLFAGHEERQHREFMEKYNFDPVNDEPLPGRFEWVKLNNL